MVQVFGHRPNRAPERGGKPSAAEGIYTALCHRLFFRPIQTFRLLRKLGRHMKTVDILRLLWSPFRKRTLTRRPELPEQMIEQDLTAPIRTAMPPA